MPQCDRHRESQWAAELRRCRASAGNTVADADATGGADAATTRAASTAAGTTAAGTTVAGTVRSGAGVTTTAGD